MTNNFKKDFPIFKNNKNLIYLDNTATTQKPSYVTNEVKRFYENDYSNIHRWAYSLSERSEIQYEDAKKIVAEFLNAEHSEISFTYNSTYASNLLAHSLWYSKILKKWDIVLVSESEHHANIVPWYIIRDIYWIEVKFIKILKDWQLDFDNLENILNKYKDNIKTISLTQVSNVTGTILNTEKLNKILDNFYNNNKPFLILDASQSFPHFKVDVKKINADFVFLTWHKIMSESWIWVLWGKKELLKKINPWLCGWWSINWVSDTDYSPAWLPSRFEPWTPNIWWAISLKAALEYIKKIWWYKKIIKIEESLIKYMLDWFKKLEPKWVKLIWSKDYKNRVWVFSFIIPEKIHIQDAAEYFADNWVCIRAGHHCAEPLMQKLWIKWSLRASLYIYNTKDDIDIFFKVLNNIL